MREYARSVLRADCPPLFGRGNQISHEEAKEALTHLLSRKIVGQNLKFDLAVIEHNFGLQTVNLYADTMILAWLLNPESNVGLDTLSKRFFNHEMIKFKDVVAKGENFSGVSLEKLANTQVKTHG